MEDGIYIPREHFLQLLSETDQLIALVDRVTRINADIVRCRSALIAARRRIKENDPDLTPVRASQIPDPQEYDCPACGAWVVGDKCLRCGRVSRA